MGLRQTGRSMLLCSIRNSQRLECWLVEVLSKWEFNIKETLCTKLYLNLSTHQHHIKFSCKSYLIFGLDLGKQAAYLDSSSIHVDSPHNGHHLCFIQGIYQSTQWNLCCLLRCIKADSKTMQSQTNVRHTNLIALFSHAHPSRIPHVLVSLHLHQQQTCFLLHIHSEAKTNIFRFCESQDFETFLSFDFHGFFIICRKWH